MTGASATSQPAVEVFVGMGSNIEPRVYIPQALTALTDIFGTLDVSPIYQCPAVGFDGNDFVNLVLAFHTDQRIETVQQALRQVEARYGRNRVERDGSRTMDLDMLLYGDEAFDNGDIRVPRADILDYAFVLRPLAQMRPAGVHPLLGRRYDALWADFDDRDQPLTAIEL